MTNVEALQALYAALGGTPANVANASTSVEVLNAIAALFDGDDDAIINPDAIANIAAVIGNIGGEDGSEFFFDGGDTQFQVKGNIIKKLTIPEGFTNVDNAIGTTSIAYMSGCTEINIPSTMTALPTTVFAHCTALEKITINKPEGSITGAPWGAPETTQIIWNG